MLIIFCALTEGVPVMVDLSEVAQSRHLYQYDAEKESHNTWHSGFQVGSPISLDLGDIAPPQRPPRKKKKKVFHQQHGRDLFLSEHFSLLFC